MKWLFIFGQQNGGGKSSYDFVPYKFGPFSFEARQDMSYSIAQYLDVQPDSVSIRKGSEVDATSASMSLSKEDQELVNKIWLDYHNLSREELLEFVYEEYPWYASRSELTKHQDHRKAEIAVYTIGYEGRSVDSFFNALLERGIQGVLDIRKNAFSHKYGFSYRNLTEICDKLNIEYTHLPDLGVESQLRKDLKGPDAYSRLFNEYESGLDNLEDVVKQAVEIVKTRPTTLLCFEAEPERCHRGRLAPVIAAETGFSIDHL